MGEATRMAWLDCLRLLAGLSMLVLHREVGKACQPKRMAIRTGGAEGLQRIRAFAGNQSQKLANRVGQVLNVS